MKNFKLLTAMKRTLFCFMVLFSTNTKAQDNANCGFLIDGKIVDSIPCWSFLKMQVVFPVKESWKEFDRIEIYIYHAISIFTPKKFVDCFFNPNTGSASLGAITVCSKASPTSQWESPMFTNYYNPGTPFTVDDFKRKTGYSLVLKISGHRITGTKEVYENGGYVKKPIYDNGVNLYTSKEIPFAYLKNYKGEMNKKSEKEQEMLNTKLPCNCPGKPFTLKLEPCEYSGEYISFVKGTSNSSNTKTEVKTNTTTETKTTVTKTTTTKTSTSSGALTASALKPLDKSKAGYFVEKDGSQITQEGYKKGDARNGEVRVYDEGKLRSVSTYVNDEKNGAAALYYANGNLEESGNYKNDNKDGEWKRYTEAGKLAGTDIYVDGEKQ